MKKIRLKRKKQQAAPARITNETVAEHRERILAGGRKFKYPHQYVRHRLVINAIIIAVIVVVGSSLLIWQQLFYAQNTSDFMYRLTRVAPIPVGSVDGEQMRYSDYLMRYRSQELWLSTKGQLNLTGADGKRQLDFIKREVINGVALDTFAAKKARDLKVTVSDDEVKAVIDENRMTKTGKISQEVYDASAQDTLGFSPSEYRYLTEQSLLRKKVAYEMDSVAKDTRDKVQARISADGAISFDGLAKELTAAGMKLDYGASGLVPTDNQDYGLSKTTNTLKNGEVSPAIKSSIGDGYYFVRRISGNNRQISYEYLRVPLSAFNDAFAKVKASGGVEEYIPIPTNTSSKTKEK